MGVGSCARAVKRQTVAQPNSLMNSRRLICSLSARTTLASGNRISATVLAQGRFGSLLLDGVQSATSSSAYLRKRPASPAPPAIIEQQIASINPTHLLERTE